ncbi:MAG: LacI family DNA-binding transcriptional regulator [bacterium]
MKMREKITIHEVARKAGVSVATVSRVYNNSNLVTEPTKELVRQVAAKLRYTPSVSARNLSKRSTETIGLLLPDMHGEFFSEIIRGADSVAREYQYHLLVSSSHSNKEELFSAIRTMDGRVDGLAIMSPHLDGEILNHHALQVIPTVVMSASKQVALHDTVKVDNLGGAKQVIKHLLEKGHRKIALIKGESGNEDSEERFIGCLKTMKGAGLTFIKEYILDGDFTDTSGYTVAADLLKRRERPTAIFAFNDEMAIGVLRLLREKGLKVPADIAVAGFDDIQISKLIHPSLTTVHVNISELGSRSIKLILKKLNSEKEREKHLHLLLPAYLIVRDSTRKQ